MHLDHIELSKLVVSPVNMRAKRKDRDIADLIPSVRARGILTPLLVRPNGTPDTYEIVAGRRRYFAAKAVAEADDVMPSVPCAIMEPGDDVAALEASLIENVARLDADDVTQWETFARLVKGGRSIEEIAATFGVSEQAVKRVLALGNLLPRIRALYRADEIDAATVRHLTLATRAQQHDWLALHQSPDQYAPTGRMLKEWLFGGSAIATTTALFDPSDYTAPIVGDLFEDRRYFSDSALFWTLQTKAIDEKRQAYLAAGWSDVVVISPDDHFERWAYEKRGQAKGGRVYIVVQQSGDVEIHEGFLPRREAVKKDRTDDPLPALPRPELSAPLSRYIDLHRHTIVRAHLLDQPWLALRLLLAHAVCGNSLWRVSCERQRADKEETQRSVQSCQSQTLFDAKRQEALVRLGLGEDSASLVDGCHGTPWSLFETLCQLSNEELLEIVPVIIGETLAAGSDAIDSLGALLQIDAAALWQADEAFFSLLRDRTTLLGIMSDVAGAQVARANSEVSGKVLKSIIRDYLSGSNGRAKVDAWTPRWMHFPAETYLDTDPAATDNIPGQGS